MRQKTKAYKGLVRTPERRDHLKDLGTDGRIMPNWILKELDRIE
jgi:hypothetical protein